jgi:hypothetical protein
MLSENHQPPLHYVQRIHLGQKGSSSFHPVSPDHSWERQRHVIIMKDSSMLSLWKTAPCYHYERSTTLSESV